MRTELFSGQAGRLAAWYGPAVAFLLLLAAYHIAFAQFFPNRYGRIGHDYSYVLPALLAGYYWFRANGLWEVPWFTPAFCGGQPFFADPQSSYYSVLQLLTLFADPLTSSYLTLLLFAALGYWGCYLLLRQCFAASRQSAVLAAAIFMFNGFLAHRMIVGHAGYHGFMLVPWVGYFLTVPLRGRRWLMSSAAGCLAGMVGAYWVQSGLGTLIIPAALAVGLILLAYGLWAEQTRAAQVLVRSFVGALATATLSAAKLVAGFSFLSGFPRSEYLLPGYQSIAEAVRIAFLSVFISPVDIEQRSNAVLENVQWAGGRVDLEYGVTLVPLLIMLAGLGVEIWRLANGKTTLALKPSRVILLALVGVVLFIPILLNAYSPAWNPILKQIPVLQSSSTLVRWFIIFIPFFALVPALVFQRISGRFQTSAAIVGVAVVVALNLAQDRRSYALEPYDPDTVINAYREIRGRRAIPDIHHVGVYLGADGRVLFTDNRNDLLTQGISQMLCYNPVFGYRLEKFPIRDLHPGPVREIGAGRYNIKNPACYVYPKENDCSPGDHFLETQTQAMEDFVRYRPFSYRIAWVQRVANAVTALGALASALILLAALVQSRRRERPSS